MLVVHTQEGADILGIARLRPRGGTDEVDEDDGNHLALFATTGRRCAEGRTALGAELRASEFSNPQDGHPAWRESLRSLERDARTSNLGRSQPRTRQRDELLASAVCFVSSRRTPSQMLSSWRSASGWTQPLALGIATSGTELRRAVSANERSTRFTCSHARTSKCSVDVRNAVESVPSRSTSVATSSDARRCITVISRTYEFTGDERSAAWTPTAALPP